MFVATQNLQATPLLMRRLLAALVAAAPTAIFDITTTVHLYVTGPATHFQDHINTDFTDPVFHGYAAYTLAAVLGPINTPGNVAMFQDVNYIATTGGSIPGEDIVGYYLLDAGGVNVLAWEQFPAVIPIRVIGDSVDLTMLLAPESIFGGVNG